MSPVDQIGQISEEERQRIRTILYQIGGQHESFARRDIRDVWLAEHRMRSERLASQRLMRATWALSCGDTLPGSGHRGPRSRDLSPFIDEALTPLTGYAAHRANRQPDG
jgi:hypothetical protein